MKNYSSSLYAINKRSENIVYSFVDQTKAEIALEDLRMEDPNMTEEDFETWKKWSDENYHGEDLNDYKQAYRRVAFDEAYDTADRTALSLEDEYIEKEERECASKALLELQESKDVTKTQYRRFSKYFNQGMSLREIALEENVHFTSVKESIGLALEQSKKNF